MPFPLSEKSLHFSSSVTHSALSSSSKAWNNTVGQKDRVLLKSVYYKIAIKFEKSPTQIWSFIYLVKEDDFFQILWHSQKTLTLFSFFLTANMP